MNHDAPATTTDFAESADVGAERLARVYAEALLAAADATGQADAVIGDVDSLIDDVIRKDARLGALLAGAAVGRHSRRRVLEKAFAGVADSVFYKFLMVLNEHDRLELLRDIRAELHVIDDERHRRVRVHVFTAVPLPEDFGRRIAEAVRNHFGLEPVLVPHVDPSLLGGMKVRIGDKQFDATVRARLDNLRNQIIARSSYEIQSRRDHFRTD